MTKDLSLKLFILGLAATLAFSLGMQTTRVLIPDTVAKRTPGLVFCTLTSSEAGLSQVCERAVPG